MDNPIFKLEKVVQPRSGESLEDFEGPLDLILFLLSKNKIEIQDIPIALILDQYLAYLEQRQRMDLEVASEFVTMAAHLMYIKTRMLLSIEDEEAQSEMDELIRSLEERQRSECYLKIKQLTQKLGPMSESAAASSPAPPSRWSAGRSMNTARTPPTSSSRCRRCSTGAASPTSRICRPSTRSSGREPYSVEKKSTEILDRLRRGGITRFLLLFRGSRTRSELVATFMAVLELCKNHLDPAAARAPTAPSPLRAARPKSKEYHGKESGNEGNRVRHGGDSLRLR